MAKDATFPLSSPNPDAILTIGFNSDIGSGLATSTNSCNTKLLCNRSDDNDSICIALHLCALADVDLICALMASKIHITERSPPNPFDDSDGLIDDFAPAPIGTIRSKDRVIFCPLCVNVFFFLAISKWCSLQIYFLVLQFLLHNAIQCFFMQQYLSLSVNYHFQWWIVSKLWWKLQHALEFKVGMAQVGPRTFCTSYACFLFCCHQRITAWDDFCSLPFWLKAIVRFKTTFLFSFW